MKRIYIEITNRCNLRCAFCPQSKRPPRDMSPTEFALVLEKTRQLTPYIYLHVLGEPLFHPDFLSILALCEAEKRKVQLTTNASLLPSFLEPLCGSSALRQVNISLHSATQNGLFDDSYGQNALLAAKALSQAGKYVQLRLWDLDMAEHAPLFALLQQHFGPIKQKKEGENHQKLGERLYLSLEKSFRWPSMELAPFRTGGTCLGLRQQIAVLSDGRVVPCCLDCQGDITLGNIFHQSIEEILQTDRSQAIKQGFLQQRLTEELCRRCGYADNKFI